MSTAQPDPLDRRSLFGLPLTLAALLALPRSTVAQPGDGADAGLHPEFPALDPQHVYDIVLHAHSDLDRVKGLLEKQPDLSKAAIDWGFGDWESAIGAAGHMGRADITAVLIEHGARPTLFVHAMLGHLGVVRAAVEATPGIQSTFGPHGISLLAHARSGGEAAAPVVDYLESVGGANPQPGRAALEHERPAYQGKFRYGDGLWFEIGDRRDQLFLRRGNDFARNLHHLGDGVFHPGGSLGVRLSFHFDGQDTTQRIEIRDGVSTVEAHRI